MFSEFNLKYPQASAALQSLATAAVVEVEHHLGDSSGRDKSELARRHVIEMLRKSYDAADVFFDFPGPVDQLVKEVAIPLLPGLIDWVVGLFNSNGQFQHGAGGVQ